MNKKTILTQALSHKDQELLNYKINIDNFRLAIQQVSDKYPNDERMRTFSSELEERLESEEFEFKKTQIIRDVISMQLNELEEQ